MIVEIVIMRRHVGEAMGLLGYDYRAFETCQKAVCD